MEKLFGKSVTLKELLIRTLMLIAGLFCIAFGVALSTKSGLGVSPSAGLPYLFSQITPVSMGTLTTLVNILFIIAQIALLRKNYQPVQLLQLLVVFVFGFFTDFTIGIVAPLTITGYPIRLLLCVASCAVMAFGVFLEVKAGLLVMASEGAINAVVQVFHLDFGKVKMGLDLTFVALSTLVSLIVYHRLEGIREGTIISAVLVGMFVHLYQVRLRFADRLLSPRAASAPLAKSSTPLVITIERELGSGGHELGEKLAKALDIAFYDYALIEKTAEQTGFALDEIRQQEERLSGGLLERMYRNSYAASQQMSHQDMIFAAQGQVIRDLAATGSCVIVGRLGSYVLRGQANCFHIFISADQDFRAQRIAAEDGTSLREAKQRLMREDAFRHNYCQHFTGEPWGLARHYALALDMAKYGVDNAVKVVLEAINVNR